MTVEEMKSYLEEQSKLMLRILSILEYSNLQDLKTINSFLFENGFTTEKEMKNNGR